MRCLFIIIFATFPSPLYAQSADDIDIIRKEIAELRAEQAATAARITGLETKLDAIGNTRTPDPKSAARFIPYKPQAIAAPVQPALAQRPKFSGDIRLRYESNFGDQDARNRDRFVLRARLRGIYAISDAFSVGAQLTTGDPDDPNSSDVTLSNFNDDLAISLDQIWLRAKFGTAQFTGGKVPLPFKRTDMVWDGDVHPEGLSATFSSDIAPAVSVSGAGLYFIIDENIGGADSRMIGGQLGTTVHLDPNLTVSASAGYYDYRLKSILGGDVGDFRSNRFANGRYLSDFDLVDLIASATWTRLSARWPITVAANWVGNLGATTAADDGISINLTAGRSTQQRDWRIGYGYAKVGVDAVFAAFSEDNTALGSNYLQHNLSLDFVLRPHLILNGVFYRYRQRSALDAGANAPNNWLNRLRINLLAEF